MNIKETILFINSSSKTQNPLHNTLSSNGFDILQYNSSIKTADLLEDRFIPLVLLEQNLSDYSDLDNFEKLKSKSPSTEFIFLVDQFNQTVAEKALNMGVFSYFDLPIDKVRFLHLVHKAIDLAKLAHKNIDSINIHINKTSNPILVIDLDGNYMDGNKAACNFLECSLEELLSKNVRDYLQDGPNSEKILEYHQRLWHESGTVETNYQIDDQVKTLMLSITPGYFRKKKAIFGFGIDITEKKESEKKLALSEQRSKWLYDNAPIPYHILSSDAVILDVNQRWCDVLGYSRDEVIGKEIFDFVYKEEKNDALTSFNKKKQSKQTFIEGSDRRYITKDGQIRIFKTFDHYVYDKENSPISIQTTIEDITNEKIAEKQQQQNLERLKSIVNLLQLEFDEKHDFLENALLESIKLTESKVGYVYIYNQETREIVFKIWHPKNKIKKKKLVFNLEEIGPLGDPIRLGKFIIKNNYKRSKFLSEQLKDWHIDINNFLAVPIKDNGKFVAVICVSNKNGDYDESDAVQLSLLMESIWRIKMQHETMEALSSNERLLHNLIDATQDIVLIKDEKLRIIMANQAALKCYGVEAEEIINKTDFDLSILENAQKAHASDQEAFDLNDLIVKTEQFGDKYFEARKFPILLNDKSVGLGAFIRDITQKVKSEESLRLQKTALEAAANAIVIIFPNYVIDWVNPAFSKLTGYSFEESINQDIRNLVRSEIEDPQFYKIMQKTLESGKIWQGRIINRKKDGNLYHEEMTITPLLDDKGNILRHIAIKQDVTVSVQREKELSAVANVSAALRSANSRDEMLPIILDQLIEQLNVEAATITSYHKDTKDFTIELGRGLWENTTGFHIPFGFGISKKILDSGQAYLNTINGDPDTYKPELFYQCKYLAAVPMIVQNNKLGLLYIGSNRQLFERDVRVLTAVADIAANAIHRSTLHEKTESKVKQLNSFRVIDTAINTSLDLRVTLDVVLKQAKQLLQCDALTVLLSKPQTMWLEPIANLGFQTKQIKSLRLHIGNGIASKSILERQVVWINHSEVRDNDDSAKLFLEGEDFQTYYTAPLIVKGAVKGVLVVFYRQNIFPDSERIDTLKTLATQTAIAIDSAELFNSLKRSAADLTFAYNETIEGWAKALELHDQETKGHSKRVTNLTLRLATKMGIKDKDIGHIMRGALLHDIGKMGIPGAILNKPGKLTADEWEIIRNHPGNGYKMLSSIKYLKPALDIPYCHHEKWDGSGYPRNLKTEEIPLAARIFAIVDVWDALTSDRPYRKAWSTSKAREYILEQSSKHFDPKVVEVFVHEILPDII